MKKLLLVLTLVGLFSAPAAQAQSLNAAVDVSVKASTTGNAVSNERRNENSMASSPNNSVHATGSIKSTNGNASTTGRTSGNVTAEAHRSAVATFVQNLRATGERDGGIGAEVRAVAQSQNDIASTTVDAMTKIETRSKLVSLLFGTDWESVGAIRSAIAQHDSDIQSLETAVSLTTSASVRAELEAEIEALIAVRADLEEFVTSHESSFSLFGWLTKLFVSANA